MRARRAIALAIIGSTPFAAISCSLFTPLDDLQSGKDSGSFVDTRIESSPTDTATGDTTSPIDAGPIDSGLQLLSCNADGLVAYWPMNEGSGLTITDCTQNIMGLFQGTPAPAWGTRADGGNLEFSGSGNINISANTALQLGGPFTLDGWFRSDGAPPAGYASLFWSFEQPAGFEITESFDGTLYAQVGVAGDAIRADFTEPPPTGVWEHLTAVFEPGVNLRVYVNGVMTQSVNTLESGDALPDEPAGLNSDGPQMGPVFNSSSSWTGGIDEVRIFSRALTDDEILFLATHT